MTDLNFDLPGKHLLPSHLRAECLELYNKNTVRSLSKLSSIVAGVRKEAQGKLSELLDAEHKRNKKQGFKKSKGLDFLEKYEKHLMYLEELSSLIRVFNKMAKSPFVERDEDLWFRHYGRIARCDFSIFI